MKKKLALSVVVVALAFYAVGCGGSSTPPTKPSPDTTTTPNTTADDKTEEAKPAEPAQ